MSDYEPTFEVSPPRRPLIQRLTPLAWVLIGGVVLVVILGIVAGVLALTGRPSGDEQWWTPTVAPTPSETPVLPTATPTEWWEGMVSPTPVPLTPTPAFPAWWSDQMTQDENGHWWPPDEVVEMVREDWQACEDAFKTLVIDNDADGVIESLPRCYTGLSLDGMITIYDGLQTGEETLGYVEWEDTLLQVQVWSSDGLQCTLGCTALRGTIRQWVDGELILVDTNPGGLYRRRMQYDPTDGRWKQVEFIDFTPAPEG